ncbi:uncharacterized protein KY384_002569 [Bacidia gigantensis]|uniref:uncharacterized protein n=1 Tax=Bacidia gigantensis TaxID=2732470 RepID=UPI001D0457DF|nr:uncharacterized protein KY384_002569 [Bacidia gigantensis]KAG8532692.1 hypothetical protein KY384_002569 [Bacidia gigantensis]
MSPLRLSYVYLLSQIVLGLPVIDLNGRSGIPPTTLTSQVIDNEYPLDRVLESKAASENPQTANTGRHVETTLDLTSTKDTFQHFDPIEVLPKVESEHRQNLHSGHHDRVPHASSSQERLRDLAASATPSLELRRRGTPEEEESKNGVPVKDIEAEKQRKRQIEKQEYIQRGLAHVLETSKWLQEVN